MTGQRLPRLIAPGKCDIVTAELRKGGSGSAMAGKSEHLKRAAAWILILFTLFFPQRALHEDPEEAQWIVTGDTDDQKRVEDRMNTMTLHEKICQLFFVAPEELSEGHRVYSADPSFLRAFDSFPVGGIILFSVNIRKNEIAFLNAGMQSAAVESCGIGLFIGVDEEGGRVSRVANKLKLKEKQPNPAKTGTPDNAYASGKTIGEYLSEYGFNLDFAPVADVRSNVKDAEITVRSYGTDPEQVGRMVPRFTTGLHSQKIIAVLKHFPGHGAVSGNTHNGAGISLRTLEELREADFIPFIEGIAAGADMVMLSHQTAKSIDPERPASLSPTVVRILREELGFEGVIITDALRMKAVSNRFGPGEACVMALEAGADMLLLPGDFTDAYHAVVKAVEEGRIAEERINESVKRILLLKDKYGLLKR